LTAEIGLPGCDDTPVVQALDEVVTIYAGTGGDYPVVGTMLRGEVRLVVGRAGFADWWNIQWDLTTTAWVDDEDVAVYGNTGGVPIVEPPPIDGNTPTPGPIWMPTALPACTTTPTATPTETPTATATATADVTAAASLEEIGADSSGGDAAATTPAPLSTPELVTAPPTATPYILPAVGAGLLGLGLVVGLLARRSGRATPSDAGDESPAEGNEGE
jgi:hypothetical protein